MKPEAGPVALSFAGTFCGSFTLAIALLAGDGPGALGAFAMTVYCGAEFVQKADFTVPW